jgi:beta-aspartyl-peptidase (threonine type)
MRPVVVVHGGAGTATPDLHEAAVAGTRRAALASFERLMVGASAQEAAVVAVRILEDDEAFNAGRGACMTADGRFEMDAAIMRSHDLRAGAVASVPEVRDAIVLAEAVLEHTPHVLLAGEGALRFARARGIGHFGRDEVWTQKAQDRFDAAVAGAMRKDNRADTVGAVVLDSMGNTAAAGSTGGVLLKMPGRVGDTPQVGAGLYAHPELGAAAATGVGEVILQHVMCHSLLLSIANDDPQASAEALCRRVSGRNRSAVGIIAVLPDGRFAVAHESDHMAYAVVHPGPDGPIVAGGLRRPAGAC